MRAGGIGGRAGLMWIAVLACLGCQATGEGELEARRAVAVLFSPG
jgi:hypothetical protein